jgi:hypothetical protein
MKDRNKMRIPWRVSLVLILCLCYVSSVQAGVLVGSPGVAGDGLTIPFGNGEYPGYQQLFDHNLFQSVITNIGGLSFFARNDPSNSPTHDPFDPNHNLIGAIRADNYTIRLGIVPYGTVLGNDLDGNLTSAANLTYFFTGQLSANVDDHFTVASNQSNFLYDPSAGDLILDVRNTASTDLLTLGLDYDNTPANGLSIAFYNIPTPNIQPPGCELGCTLTDFGLVTQFEDAGQSQDVPILPNILNSGSYQFTDQPSGSWFDPATAFGFHYIGLPNSDSSPTLFSSIVFPTGFLSAFSLLDASDLLLGTFSGGDSYTFATPVSEFSIIDLNPLVDPTVPTAFPLLINFADPTGTFQMDPLLQPPTPPAPPDVPEPATIQLICIAALLGGYWRLRQAPDLD